MKDNDSWSATSWVKRTGSLTGPAEDKGIGLGILNYKIRTSLYKNWMIKRSKVHKLYLYIKEKNTKSRENDRCRDGTLPDLISGSICL